MKKMIMIKSRLIAILFLGMAVMLVSCGQSGGEIPGREERVKGGTGQKKGQVPGQSLVDLVMAQIDSLKVETCWSHAKTLYEEVKVGIGYLNKDERRDNLLISANNNFCYSMDTIMCIILSGECEPRHNELYEIHMVRNGEDFSLVHSTSLHDRVEKDFKSHEDMLKTTLPQLKRSGQSPETFTSQYSEKIEKKKVKEASNYLAQNPSCSQIKTGLEEVSERKLIKKWRKDFCGELVELYLQKPYWKESDENNLKGALYFYTNVYTSDTTEWFAKIREFKKEHQK